MAKEKPQPTDLTTLLAAFEDGEEAVELAKRAVSAAEFKRDEARKELGRVIVPKEAATGEGFCVLIERKDKEPRRIVVRKSQHFGDFVVEDWKPRQVAAGRPEVPTPHYPSGSPVAPAAPEETAES